MGKNFASIHIIGVSKENVISHICPLATSYYSLRELNYDEKNKLLYLKQILGDDFILSFKKESFEFGYLNQPYIILKSKNAFSVFSSAFEMLSLNNRVRMCFDYEDAPPVLGFSTDSETIIRIFLYQNKKIIANLCFYTDSTKLPIWIDEIDNSEYKFGSFGMEHFVELFGFSLDALNYLISKHKDFNILCRELSNLFGLSFNLTYDEISCDIERYNGDRIN